MINISVIIQARMGSTRLPGKIMMDLSGKPVLWHVYNRLAYVKNIHKIIIATTDKKEDQIIEKYCKENNIICFRGSESDVLLRYYEAAKFSGSDIIIRITSDCPLIDPQVINKMIGKFLSVKVDYLSNSLIRSFPRGLDAEIFTFQVLERANLEATKEFEREHVTPYIYQHPEIFSLHNFKNSVDFSFHRWTLDTKDDYRLIKKIYENLYSEGLIFLLDEILDLFEKNPELYEINKHVKQKEF